MLIVAGFCLATLTRLGALEMHENKDELTLFVMTLFVMRWHCDSLNFPRDHWQLFTSFLSIQTSLQLNLGLLSIISEHRDEIVSWLFSSRTVVEQLQSGFLLLEKKPQPAPLCKFDLLFSNLLRKPFQTLVETLSLKRTGGLNVPVSSLETVKP